MVTMMARYASLLLFKYTIHAPTLIRVFLLTARSVWNGFFSNTHWTKPFISFKSCSYLTILMRLTLTPPIQYHRICKHPSTMHSCSAFFCSHFPFFVKLYIFIIPHNILIYYADHLMSVPLTSS